MELLTSTGRCEFLIGNNLEDLTSLAGNRKIVAIVDKNVQTLYGKRLSGFEVIAVGDGEETKTLRTAETIYNRFLEIGVNKSYLVVGIGGGVVCDLAGFTASTFMRGVSFGFVPTTLLAQVDASIGGKNGVNLDKYKNLVGTIKQPEFCLIDPSFLKTLPRTIMISGLAEVVKAGVIADASLFEFLESNFTSILKLNHADVIKLINSAISIKIDIVKTDEFENWERMKLNFGHTIGHAIEKVAGIPHGEAVSIGMVGAAMLSVSKGMLSNSEMKRIIRLLQEIGLPTSTDVSRDEIMSAMAKDKKQRGGNMNMVLLEGIGSAVIVAVEKQEVLQILDEVCI